MGVLGIIPARHASERLPGKPLADLGGKPLVVRVWENACGARRLDALVAAVDHEDVRRSLAAAGARVVMTPPELASGSDRVARAAADLDPDGSRYPVVVNVQGDEPFLPVEAIDRAVALLEEDGDAAMATLAVPGRPRDLERPDVVKVVLDARGRALYFSRAPIPFRREGGAEAPVLRHLGLYVFRRSYLDRFVGLPPSRLERCEKLEQLRALEDGARIAVAVGAWDSLGVDTPGDLEEARRRLAAAP